MIKNKGFALLAVTFMLVSLISLAFLAVYPLVAKSRDDTRFFITKMRFRRYERALFGRLADQCGGKFTNCGGYASDYPSGGGVRTGGSAKDNPYGMRYFKASLITGYIRPVPFKYYNNCGFWRGYRGKRYLYPLPSDDWKEERKEGPFLGGHGSALAGMFSGCSRRWTLKTLRGGSAKFNPKKIGIYFNGPKGAGIKVKDYSPDRNQHMGLGEDENFRVCLVGFNELLPYSHSINERGDYILHSFKLWIHEEGYAGNARLFEGAGLNKVLIQVKENGEWVTKSAPGVVLPVWSKCASPKHTTKTITWANVTLDYYD